MKKWSSVRGAMWAVGTACVIYAHVADACGGVFVQPGAAQLVTDNNMVLSLSSQQTTLWTQPRYTGRAQDFAWVFPLRYTSNTRINLGSEVFMRVTEALTAPRVVPPFPVPTSCDRSVDGSVDGAAPPDSGVSVLVNEPLGPYHTVVLRGSDPMALRTWLQTNAFAVPTAIEPTLGYYTSQGMDFVALRLRQGQDTDRIRAVRITMPGAVTRLPLRMIAAGAADHVRLRLVVFSAGRTEAMNFPNGEVTNDDLVWDWSRANDLTGAFASAFQQLNARNGGRLWLTETARSRARAEWIEAGMRRVTLDGGSDDGTGDGGAPPTASTSDDIATAFGPHGDRAYVTRLTADLAVSLLDRDLDLAASAAGDRADVYAFGRELNRPAPPMCGTPDGSVATPDVGAADADAAVAPRAPTSSTGCACRTTHTRPHGTRSGLFALSAVLAFVSAARRRGLA